MTHTKEFHIPISVIREADKCQRDHACVNDPDYLLCGTSLSTSKNTARLVCSYDANCPYSATLGGNKVCTCPVRHEIFRKNGR